MASRVYLWVCSRRSQLLWKRSCKMVGPSKLFSYPLNQVHCGCILHSRPHQSCVQAVFWNFYRNSVSSAKYYLPTVLVMPLIMSCRRMTKKRLRATIQNFLETTFIATSMNTLTFFFLCVFRRLHGRFLMVYTPFVSCFLGASINWWAPPKVLQFFVTGMTHSTLEAVMRQLEMRLVHCRTAQTLFFMLSSLVVMRQQQKGIYTGFWFIRPEQLPLDYGKWSLKRRLKQAFMEVSTYVGIGVTMDCFNNLLRGNFKKLQLKSTSFIVSYMTIYKVVQLVFAGRLDLNRINLLAAFLSGSSFALFGHVPFSYMCYAVVIAIQALWLQLCSLNATGNARLATLQSIPWAKLLIPPNMAYLTHCMMYHGHVVSSLARAFLDDTCDNNVGRIYSLLNLPMETILKKVDKMPKAPFFC